MTKRFGACVRPVEDWQTILKDRTPQQAASRIFGDLICYRSEVRKGIITEKREGYEDDVEQLARALRAFASHAHDDLVAALQAALRCLPAVADAADPEECRKALQLARAALAKATQL